MTPQTINVEKLVPGSFYFFELQPTIFEGQLRIGLGMIKSIDKDASLVSVKWFIRKAWGKHRQFDWSNPTFMAGRDPASGRIPWLTTQPLSDILPFLPRLTSKSSDVTPRLHIDCVRDLTVICEKRGLIHPDEDENSLEAHGAPTADPLVDSSPEDVDSPPEDVDSSPEDVESSPEDGKVAPAADSSHSTTPHTRTHAHTHTCMPMI